jgi:polysaccharide chain length determinant protein (PEP-CTERM system associated)
MHELIERLWQYSAGIWQRRWSVLGVAWLVCIVGWTWVGLMPNRYTSSARLYVDTQTILAPLMKGVAVTPDIQRQVEMMRSTLLSRPNVERLIRMTDLDRNVHSPLDLDNLIDRLTHEVILRMEGDNLFKVIYENTDPAAAYRVVDAILQIFVDQNLGHSQKDVERALDFIDNRLKESEQKLRDSELKIAAFRREHAEELGDAKTNLRDLDAAQSNLRLLESQLEAAIWQRDQQKLELAKTPKRLAAAELGKNGLSPEGQRLNDLKDQLGQALLVYTERHPTVIHLRALIAQQEAELAQETGHVPRQGNGRTAPNPVYEQLASGLHDLDVEIDSLGRRITLQQEEIRRLADNVAATPQVEADLKRLTRDYDVLVDEHTKLAERRQAALLAQHLDTDTSTVDFRIIDPPTHPLEPSGPPHGILMAGVLVVGLGAGVALALVRVLLRTSFTSETDLRDALQLPVLGSVAVAPHGLGRRAGILRRFAFTGGAAALLLAFGAVFYFSQLAVPALSLLAVGQPQRGEARIAGTTPKAPKEAGTKLKQGAEGGSM